MSNYTIKDLQVQLLKILEDFDNLCNDFNFQYSLAAGTLLGAIRHKGFIPWDDDIDIYMPRDSFDALMAIDDREFFKRGYTLQRAFSEAWPSGYCKMSKNGTTYIENYKSKIKNQHHGLFIDIIPIDNLSDNYAFERMQWLSYRIITAKALAKRGYKTNNLYKKMAMLVMKNIPDGIFRKICINKNNCKTKQVHCFLGAARYLEKNVFPRSVFENYTKIAFEGKEFFAVTNYELVLSTQYGDYMTLPPEEDRQAALHAVLVDFEHELSDYEIEERLRQKS